MRRFMIVLIAALSIFCLSLYLRIGAPNAPDWLTADFTVPWMGYLSWLVGLLLIFVSALALRNSGLDLVVASEFMVVYGIFGLLLNLASGVVVAVPEIDANSAELKLAVLRPILEPFAEGLAAAGTAPLFAVILRLFDAEPRKGDNGADDALAAYKALKDAADAARLSITTSGNDFKTSIGKVSAAANDLSTALKGSGTGVSTELEKALEALRHINSELEGLATNSQAASTHMRELASNAQSANQLLQALGDTIDRVTNFVRAL